MLSQLNAVVEQWVAQWGYLGIFAAMVLENVVPPIPSEVIMPLAGFYVGQGQLNFFGVVLAGLPSQGEALVDELLDALRPECVVVMAGERPATHRLAEGTRRRLRRWAMRNAAALWITDEGGAVEVRCRGGRWWLGASEREVGG